jgi:hypothetical protein
LVVEKIAHTVSVVNGVGDPSARRALVDRPGAVGRDRGHAGDRCVGTDDPLEDRVRRSLQVP